MGFVSTMSAGSVYPGGRRTGQESVNPAPGTASTVHPPSALDGMPVLPGIAGAMSISMPMLIALGVLCYWLFTQYD